MIQRIQTVFLLLVAIISVATLFVPIAEIVGQGAILKIEANQFAYEISGEYHQKMIGVGIISSIVAALAIFIVFLFKNRELQIKLGKLNILLLTIELAAIFFYISAAQDTDESAFREAAINYKIGVIFPIISLIFMYMAIRFIKKDDDMLKASNRIR